MEDRTEQGQKRSKDRQWANRHIVEVLAFLLLLIALLHQIADADLWYHLSIGREIVRQGGLPASEFLVWANADAPAALHEWGYGLVFYSVHQLGGYRGLGIVNALICMLMFWCLFRAVGQKPLTRLVAFSLIIPVYFWMELRLVYRVETVLYLALACQIWLLEKFLIDRDWRRLAAIPILALLLSQFHPSVVILLLVLGAYAVQVIWQSRNDGRTLITYAWWLLVCALASFCLAAVNPYGWEQIFLPFTLAEEKRITNQISEFIPTLKSHFKWEFISLVILGSLAVLINRSRRAVDWLLLLGFGYLAYRYVRNIGLLALVLYVPIALGFSDFLENVGKRLPGTFFRIGRERLTGLLQVMVAVAFVLFVANRVFHGGWGTGVAEGVFPEEAASMIKEIQPPGRLFNYYEMGGYLGWALDGSYRVSVDGRHYRVNRAFALHTAVSNAHPGWQTALERYGVNSIVIKGTAGLNAKMIPLAEALADDEEWLLAGRWTRSMLFFRKGTNPQLPTEFYLDKRLVWEQVRSEAESYLWSQPYNPFALHTLGESLWRLGRNDAAIESLSRSLVLDPGNRRAARRLEQIRAGIGKVGQIEDEDVSRENPQ